MIEFGVVYFMYFHIRNFADFVFVAAAAGDVLFYFFIVV